MRCETVREHLKAYSDRELDPVTAWNTRRHLGRCAGCAAELESLQRLHDLLLAADVVERAAFPLLQPGREDITASTNGRWRRPIVVAAAGLAGAAMAAALLFLKTDPGKPGQREIVIQPRVPRITTPADGNRTTSPSANRAPGDTTPSPGNPRFEQRLPVLNPGSRRQGAGGHLGNPGTRLPG